MSYEKSEKHCAIFREKYLHFSHFFRNFALGNASI